MIGIDGSVELPDPCSAALKVVSPPLDAPDARGIARTKTMNFVFMSSFLFLHIWLPIEKKAIGLILSGGAAFAREPLSSNPSTKEDQKCLGWVILIGCAPYFLLLAACRFFSRSLRRSPLHSNAIDRFTKRTRWAM